MAYSAPTKDQFTAIFPAFSAVTDDAYTFWSARAARIVDPISGCLGDDADLAAMLATAHYLTQAGLGTGSESKTFAQGASGFKRIKSGTIELERADGAGSSDAGEWGATSYGLRLWPMLRACLAGPRVTGTGALPCGGGYQGGPFPWAC